MYMVATGTQPCPLPQYNKQLVSADVGAFVSSVCKIRDLKHCFRLSGERHCLYSDDRGGTTLQLGTFSSTTVYCTRKLWPKTNEPLNSV